MELERLRLLTDEESNTLRLGLEKELDELLYREEIMWMQRSRIAWLREGDRNTKFFHRRASVRRRKNRVRRLKRGDGSWTSNDEEMGEMATDFFRSLYTREEEVNPCIITDCMRSCVDEDMNNKLCAPFTEKKLVMASFKLGP